MKVPHASGYTWQWAHIGTYGRTHGTQRHIWAIHMHMHVHVGRGAAPDPPQPSKNKSQPLKPETPKQKKNETKNDSEN